MQARGADGKIVREEGLNTNIGIFTIIKYLIVLDDIFSWYKFIEKNRNPKNLVQLVNVQMNAQSMNNLHAFV